MGSRTACIAPGQFSLSPSYLPVCFSPLSRRLLLPCNHHFPHSASSVQLRPVQSFSFFSFFSLFSLLFSFSFFVFLSLSPSSSSLSPFPLLFLLSSFNASCTSSLPSSAFSSHS